VDTTCRGIHRRSGARRSIASKNFDDFDDLYKYHSTRDDVCDIDDNAE
jgi:hypothetical protein